MWKEEITTNRSSINSTKTARKKGFTPFFYLKSRIAEIDFDLFLVFFLFLGIGLVQVYSTSFIFATEKLGNGLFFFYKQALFSVVSVCAMLFFMSVPLKYLRKLHLFIWAAVTLTVFAVFIPGIGVKVGGALRWIQLPFGFRFEGAEYLKVFLPLVLAGLMTSQWRDLKSWALPLKAVILLTPILVLLKHPDFGSFFIASAVIFTVFFCFGLAWRYIIGLGATGFVAFLALIWYVPYRKARLMAFLDPWSDPSGSSFQVVQSMLSIYGGGVTGKGLGQSQAKLFFLPEAHTDFTFAVFGEEYGFIGVLVLIALYGFVVLKGVRISLKLQDYHHRIMAIGLTAMFTYQVFINIGVNVGLLPTKGLTLPFLSYGGSSLVAMGVLFGLLLNISRFQTKAS